MTTELAVAKNYLMLDDPAKVGSILEMNLGGEKLRLSDLDRVKIPTGGMTQWAIQTEGGEEYTPALTGIIVHMHSQRTYYQGEYTGGNEPPDCSSNDGVTPFGNPGDELRLAGKGCNDCPLAEFGSGRNGGQACRQSKLVYMVQPGSLLPIVVSIAPTSLGNMRKYLLRLGTTPYWSVVTTLKLKQVISKSGIKYSTAVPESAGRLTEVQAQQVYEFREALVASLQGNNRYTEDDVDV